MDEFRRIGFIGAGRTASVVVLATSVAGYCVSVVAGRLFVSVSAFTEPVGSG